MTANIENRKRLQQFQTLISEAIDDALKEGLEPRSVVDVVLQEAESVFDRAREFEQQRREQANHKEQDNGRR